MSAVDDAGGVSRDTLLCFTITTRYEYLLLLSVSRSYGACVVCLCREAGGRFRIYTETETGQERSVSKCCSATEVSCMIYTDIDTKIIQWHL